MSAPRQGADAFAPGAHPIDAYGAGAFRFAEMSHVGSILATPKGIGAVAAAALAEVGPESLARLFAELDAAPASVEFIVIGAGAKMAPLPPALAALLRGRGLRFESMATGAALRMYNIMLDEGRRVAALLIAAP